MKTTDGRTPPTAAPAGVAALERGLALLGALVDGADALTLAELAAATGMYKSTLLRLAASLVRLGYLQRQPDGRYRLGPAAGRLGRRYQQAFRLADLVRPALAELAARSGESAAFYVRDGDRDVCLYRHESHRPIRDAGVAEGDSFPIDSSLGSRVLSAHLAGSGHEALRRQLVVVTHRSKRIAGASAVICPVFGADRRLAGTLVLSGPQPRFTAAAVAAMKRAIAAAAVGLTESLGGDATVYRPPPV